MEETSPYLNSQDTSSTGNQFTSFDIFSSFTDYGYIIIFIIIMLIVIYFAFDKNKNEWFLNSTELSDPQHDDFLENQINILNKMQEQNLQKTF